MQKIKLILTSITLLCVSSMTCAESVNDDENIIIITSDYRHQQEEQQSTSLTVLDQDLIEEAGEQHFEEILNWIPNLNWSGGTSRPRFFQIRGIGERSQYQGAPNPSVGFVVDDIDLSGIGGIATLFDVQQIEVLKGPQGARYGANALGGLVYVKTLDPTQEFEGRTKITLGEDNTQALGFSLSGPLTEKLGYRLALQQHNSDGFRDNQFLNKTDTNERDELTARLKLNWILSSNLKVDFTFIKVELNNGYDAWVQNNSLVTNTDKPGRDEQDTQAAAIKLTWTGNKHFDFTSISTVASSDILFSFDGDWGNPQLWGVNGPFDFDSKTERYRKTLSQELRWVSKPEARILSNKADWLIGVYALNLKEKNDNLDLFNSDVFNQLNSQYDATNTALFAELDYYVSPLTKIKTGLRVEKRSADYLDSRSQKLSPSETMVGGHVTLDHLHGTGMLSYVSLSRGFKAGGFNVDNNIPGDRIEFDAEHLWNLETGIKTLGLNGRLKTNVSIFYMEREDQQVETSFQDDPSDPLSFTFVTDNATSGNNYGMEAELEYSLTDNLKIFSNLGLLFTEFDSFIVGDKNLKDREQAHAPKYTYAIGATYRGASNNFARLDITGKDEFFFSNSHDQKSKNYNLVNVKYGYEFNEWSIYLWGRNIFDKEYAVRGFFFANEPPDWIETLFTRQGDPAQWGVTANYYF